MRTNFYQQNGAHGKPYKWAHPFRTSKIVRVAHIASEQCPPLRGTAPLHKPPVRQFTFCPIARHN